MTGISKSGFAGGAGVLAVPLLSLVLPVPTAAALMLPLLLVMDIKTVRLYRNAIEPKKIAKITFAAVFGIALAGSAMSQLSPVLLQLALGIFSILFASWDKLIPLLGRLPGAAFLWGGISGITSTLLHAGGPPIAIYFLSKKIDKQQWLAQAAMFFAVMNFIKLIPYSLNNLWSFELLLHGLILVPVALLGVKLGNVLQQNISQQTFIKLCRVLLALSGLILLIKLI